MLLPQQLVEKEPGARARLTVEEAHVAARVAHLHQHTAYSLLDGAARIKDLMRWVKEVSPENPTVAMTDHGNMHGAVEFYKTAEKEGVKPILGFEAYVTAGSRFEKKRPSSKLDGGYFHLTLLAKDFKGYQNLCKLNSRGWLEGFYMKPRVDHELLREYSEGLVGLSACLAAEVPRALIAENYDEAFRIWRGVLPQTAPVLAALRARLSAES